jgi:uncharacterized protein YbbC (DUF1343 family)
MNKFYYYYFFVLLFGWPFLLQGTAPMLLGAENIPHELVQWLRTRRVGLIMNHTSLDRRGQRAVDILLQEGITVARLFAPEHGLDGSVAAERDVHHTRDAATGIPVIGIYNCGPKRADTDHGVVDLDVLIFDMQDAGMRHFTYISTLLHMLQCAASCHIPFIVLDRPNPLGGCMEGPVGPLLHLPHVTLAPVSLPVRHGLTVGELARYFNHQALHNKVDVRVVPMQGYCRSMSRPPVASYALSPNIQSYNACCGYSFLGLLGEIRPFDVAISTAHAFECILLPEDCACPATVWSSLRTMLEQQSIKTSAYSYMSTRKKKQCRGLMLACGDCNEIGAFQTLLSIVQCCMQVGVPISFSPGFDHAVGTQDVRLFLTGALDKTVFVQRINDALHTFLQHVQPFLLYTPAPRIVVCQ